MKLPPSIKSILYITTLLLIISCSNTSQESLPLLPAGESSKVETADNADPEECIFDQETQTDDFLKGIKELEGYKWDQESRTATILLEQGNTLSITRGGCYHFTVTAAFYLSNDNTDYSNWSNVYPKVMWIAKLLEKEFFYEVLKEDIDSNSVNFESYSHADIASFENEMLVDNGYTIERSQLPGKTIIVLTKTII